MRALGLTALALLTGCATPEYRFAERQCRATYDAEIPPRFERQVEEGFRFEDVPTGFRQCRVVDGRKRCEREYRREFVPYRIVRTVDVNAPRRQNLVTLCAQQQCLRDYGDVDCKT